MVKKIVLIAWIMGLLVLTGCALNAVETPTAVIMPTPTTHPFLSGQDSDLSNVGIVLPTNQEADLSLEESETAVSFNVDKVFVIVDDNNAVITWATDTTAISDIAYGRTELYELGQVGEAIPLVQHAVTLDKLEQKTTYYYRITATQSSTGAVSISEGSFKTLSLAPVINIWYGLNQEYGHMGTPQRWFNVLGDVSDPDEVASLSYSLNGAPDVALSMGPDLRRLATFGDFNVDIDRYDLVSGQNEVVITATDTLGYADSVTVIVDYRNDVVWSGNYAIEWQNVTNIQDVAQIVDGFWELQEEGVRSVVPNYDRLIAIGDIAWTDYEVVTPITIHEIELVGGYSGAPGLGYGMRWTGHTDFPATGWQPKVGWLPLGVLAWFRWDEPDSVFLRLNGTIDEEFEEIAIAPPQLEVRYMFKLRVNTMPDGESLYRFKVWPESQPEPEDWDLSGEFVGTDNGSLILVSHQIDATFGNVTITELAPPTPTPELPNITGDGYFKVTAPITNTLPITETSPITGTVPVSVTIPITETAKVTDTLPIQAFAVSLESCVFETDFFLFGLNRKVDGYSQTEFIESNRCEQGDLLLSKQAPIAKSTFLAGLIGVRAVGESVYA